jgi:hypothetical protein
MCLRPGSDRLTEAIDMSYPGLEKKVIAEAPQESCGCMACALVPASPTRWGSCPRNTCHYIEDFYGSRPFPSHCTSLMVRFRSRRQPLPPCEIAYSQNGPSGTALPRLETRCSAVRFTGLQGIFDYKIVTIWGLILDCGACDSRSVCRALGACGPDVSGVRMRVLR